MLCDYISCLNIRADKPSHSSPTIVLCTMKYNSLAPSIQHSNFSIKIFIKFYTPAHQQTNMSYIRMISFKTIFPNNQIILFPNRNRPNKLQLYLQHIQINIGLSEDDTQSPVEGLLEEVGGCGKPGGSSFFEGACWSHGRL